MQTASFEEMRDVVRLTPGRAKLVVQRIDRLLNEDERVRLERFVEAADAAADEAVFLDRKRRSQRGPVYGREAVKADQANDAALAAVSGLLGLYARAFPEAGDALGDAARRLDAALFPKGVGALTQAPYPEAAADSASLVAEARRPRFAADVAALPALSFFLDLLAVRSGAFVAALQRDVQRRDDGNAEAEATRAATYRCEQRLHELVSAILVEHAGDGDESVARRTALLEPYFAQIGELRRRNQRQLGAIEVDPSSGELLVDDDGQVPLVPVVNVNPSADS